MKESKKGKLRFLLDTGADISLVQSSTLLGNTAVDPQKKVRVKCLRGSIVETHGAVRLSICDGKLETPFQFQLVSHQVELEYDGILGRDFLKHTRAKVCYEENMVTFRKDNEEWTERIFCSKLVQGTNEVAQGVTKSRKLILPRRAETIVALQVENLADGQEGIIAKSEITEGVYLPSSLVQVLGNQAITSILNTRDEEVEIEGPVVRLEKYEREEGEKNPKEPIGSVASVREIKVKDRLAEVLKKLKLDHLNPEERETMERVCRDYSDIFYLTGEKLSCTNAARHSINVMPGTSPSNTRPYRLPEAQIAEIGKQIDKLLREGVIEESNSPWNSPLLLVPKKDDASGEKKWRMVVDFRKLNERTIGDAYPLPDIAEILDQLGQSKYFSCLDMVRGYHQIELMEEDREKTAFSTKEGHWAYKRLPFGLKTAPSTFQRMINNVLCGLTGTRCFVFLDDIVIYAKSLAEHDSKLRLVGGGRDFHRYPFLRIKCLVYLTTFTFLNVVFNFLSHIRP